jgi:probable F420-dependent oxidoreductase
MRLPLLYLTPALLVAAVSGAALSWDGSYFLASILDRQAPYVLHSRMSVAPLHGIVILASQFTGDLFWLQTLFGLLYASVPVVALTLSWLVVRQTRPGLFVWPAVGIGLVTLPGQFFFVSEANMAVQLFWPALLGVIVRSGRSLTVLALAICIVVLFLHPASILLFGFAAIAALALGSLPIPDRRVFLGGAFAFSTFAAASLAIPRGSYDLEQMALDRQLSLLQSTFLEAVVGAPLLAYGLAALAAALLSLAQTRWLSARPRLKTAVPVLVFACLAIAGIALVAWAARAEQWRDALHFRLWSTYLTLPFLALAILEAALHRPDALSRRSVTWDVRRHAAHLLPAIFSVVLIVQSGSWLQLTARLRATVDDQRVSCVPMTSVSWLDGTPLSHWGTATYALVLEGRRPERLLLYGGDCERLHTAEGPGSFPRGPEEAKSGWFDLSGLSRAEEPAALDPAGERPVGSPPERIAMKIGISLTSTRHTAGPDVARQAEAFGFHTVWAPEHLVFPVQMPNLSPMGPVDHPYLPPDIPVHDVFVYLGQIAAATERIRLGTCVYILPLRHPIAVARSAMSLDVFSGGRFDFGIGVGWLPGEFEALGQDFATRGPRADEMIELMRRLWTEPEVAHEGRFFRFAPLKFEPKPVQRPGPPILVGGQTAPALRRAARYGDGWIGMGVKLDEAGDYVKRLAALRAEYGRSGPFEIIIGAGSPDLDTIRRFEDAGITGVYVNLWRRTGEAAEAMERYAGDVLSKLSRG